MVWLSPLLALWLHGAVAVERVHPGAVPLTAQDAPYPLDGIVRWLSDKKQVRCPRVELVTWRGDSVHYKTPVRVYTHFAEHLAQFEIVLRDTAVEVYGRAPKAIAHLGTLNCRATRTWPEIISEHAMGNGIDVAGFDFAPLPAKAPGPQGLPKALRKAFSVRLLAHWKVPERKAEDAVAQLHARFLRRLVERLTARPDIFRVMLGPAYPGHANHFHFDCAPWRLISI